MSTVLLRPPCRNAGLSLQKATVIGISSGGHTKSFSRVAHRQDLGNNEHKQGERERDREGETDALDYDPAAFVPRRPRSATQIQALVENVELVREQIKTPLPADSVSHLPSSQTLVTLPAHANKKRFIPLVLPEPAPLSPAPPTRRHSRYLTIMDIVGQADEGKRPTKRILHSFAKDDLNTHEIQTLASAMPSREVLDTAFEYCVTYQQFRAACTVVSLAFTSADMSAAHVRSLFVRLMQQFPVGQDSAHILATVQAAKKAKVQLNSSMYSALISRLALSPDCNPETIDATIKQAEDEKQVLSIHAHNNLLRYYATTQDLKRCQHIAELARSRYSNSDHLATTKCLLTQAACIVHNPDLAWEYYLDLKKKSPNCLVTFKHLHKHLLAVLITDVEKHLPRITSIFQDMANVNINLDDLNVMQKRPGYPYYCISILNYSLQHKIKPHPQFSSFVASELFSRTHADVINHYLEFKHHADSSIKDLLGSILYHIPARPEYAQDLANVLSGLHPVSAQSDATSGEYLTNMRSRDANVFAIAIDMYSKLTHQDAVTHTFQFMTNDGATPNFLVHALLFRFYFYNDHKPLRNFHFVQMKECLSERPDRAFGADLAWLSRPLLIYYCETITLADDAKVTEIPELDELRTLIPQIIPYIGFDARSLSGAEAVASLLAVRPQLAFDLVHAMKQFDVTQVNATVLQPIIDVVCVKKDDTDKKTVTREAMDILKLFKDTGITPSTEQAERLLHWFQQTKKYDSALQLLQDVITKTPMTQQLAAIITDFLINCAENKEGVHVMGVLKCIESANALTKAQYTLIARALLNHKYAAVALDVLRWLAMKASDSFASVRDELLQDAPAAPWASALKKLGKEKEEK